MAGRILFEDDITELNLNESVNIKKENTPDEGNCDQENDVGKNGQGDDQNVTQDSETGVPYELLEVNNDVITSNDEGGNINQDNNAGGNSDHLQNVITDGNKGKSKQGSRTENEDIPSEDENQEQVIANQNCILLGKVKTTPKTNTNKTGKKRPSELELLGVHSEANVETVEEYDVFGDDSRVYRKYKLRKSEQRISYKEPAEYKPERSEYDKKPGFCSECAIEFESYRKLMLHIRTVHSTPHYKCSLCSQTFKKNADLIAHKTTHNSESFLCERCKVAFSDHCEYLLHNLEHTNQTNFECPECGLTYEKYSYKLHIVTHFDKKMSCPICPSTMNGQFNLKSHMNSHNYNITCIECGKNLKSKSHYDYHMSVHTGVKKFQCWYCGKGFTNNNLRNVHTRIHTDERPYACDVCGHKFKQSGDLKKHKSTHDAVKKFSCDLCNKKFYRTECLRLHMRRHTRNNLYQCPECDRSFTSASGLKVHTMYKHLTDRPVECKLCDKKFVNLNGFQKHARSMYHKRNVYDEMNKKKGGKENISKVKTK